MNQEYHKVPKGTTPTYTFSQKWGDDPFTEAGHTQTPNALIEYAARLNLQPEECWLIVCILRFKHSPDNPYPSQARLAALINQSEDTVRRLLKRIERKGLMTVERVRGDMGHYTHSVYDFTPLRIALNECHYADHPERRPTVQKCTVDAPAPQKGPNPPRKISRNHPAKSAVTTVQNCGPNKSLEREEKRKEKDAAPPPRVYHSVIEAEKNKTGKVVLTATDLIRLARGVGFPVVLSEMQQIMESKRLAGDCVETLAKVYEEVARLA